MIINNIIVEINHDSKNTYILYDIWRVFGKIFVFNPKGETK